MPLPGWTRVVSAPLRKDHGGARKPLLDEFHVTPSAGLPCLRFGTQRLLGRKTHGSVIGRVERWGTPPLHLHLLLVWVNTMSKMLPRGGAAPPVWAWARGKGWGANLGKTPLSLLTVKLSEASETEKPSFLWPWDFSLQIILHLLFFSVF